MLLTLLSGFFMAAIFTYVSSATFVFQDQFGLSVGHFAMVFTAGAAALTAGTQINGALIGRFTPAQILRVAVLAGAAVATTMLVTALLGLGMWPLVVTLVLTLFTAGFVLPSVPTIALDANPDRAGSASALLGSFQFGVGAVVAPFTGIFGEVTAISLAAVMFGAVAVATVVFLVVAPALGRSRRGWRRSRRQQGLRPSSWPPTSRAEPTPGAYREPMTAPTRDELSQRLAVEQAERRLPSISAAWVRDGEIRWQDAIGTLDGRADGIPATADTQYRIGSITKTFVAVLVMRLREEGLLGLDDPLERYLPGTAMPAVTLRALLGHAAGTRSETDNPWWERTPGIDEPSSGAS